MELLSLSHAISKLESYSSRVEDSVIIATNNELESEYVIEIFDESIQIRQAVYFGCDQLPKDILLNVYALASDLNSRFSGCKNFIDEWGVLLTSFDILGPITNMNFIEIALGQVEFVSRCCLSLVGIVVDERRAPTSREIDHTFEYPTLQ